MRNDSLGTPHQRKPRNHDQRSRNFGGLWTVGLVIAVALAFASTLPGPLVAPVMSELLLFGAYGALFAAALRKDRVFADEITAWDQAVILGFLSLVCGFFADPEAAPQALQLMTDKTPATTA